MKLTLEAQLFIVNKVKKDQYCDVIDMKKAREREIPSHPRHRQAEQ
jgi:hypothetical protein